MRPNLNLYSLIKRICVIVSREQVHSNSKYSSYFEFPVLPELDQVFFVA